MIGFLRKTTVHQEYIKNSGFYSGILLPLSRNNEIAHPMKKPKEKETGKATGMDNSTPSRSEYFSWINNTNEGSTEAQTLINLEFFKWLRDEYGMQLDIYAFDAGNIDGGELQDMIHRHGLGEWRDATEADLENIDSDYDVGDRLLFLTDAGKAAIAAAKDAT